MKSAIHQFLEILADNDYVPRHHEIPDEVDNRDEIIAEIQAILDDDGHLPAHLIYYELNGKTDSTALTTLLHKVYQQFKSEFLAARHHDNNLLKGELLQQLDEIKSDILQAIYESGQLDDETLTQMLEVKALFCDEATEFILSQQGMATKKPKEKDEQIRCSFQWLKDDDLLTEFYNKLISNELISENTDIVDFKAVFAHIPVSHIKKPVQWEKGAKLFAYFFDELIKKYYIPQIPSWINLPYCFTYYRGSIGKYVPFKTGVKAHVTVFRKEAPPKGAELVDALFEICDSQNEKS